MLRAHIDAKERVLLEQSRVPANAGHSIHKGTPREAFVQEFLQSHLSERVAIGRGEIIDANSERDRRRNQIDIVIYKRDYPKLDFGGGVSGFLVESVVATIEVKSSLDQEGLRDAMLAARNVKSLSPNVVSAFRAGYQPPGVLSYVVAYDGPAKMQTVQGWISTIVQDNGIVLPTLPPDGDERIAVRCPTLDAIFVLGKGFIHFGNTPYTVIAENVLAARRFQGVQRAGLGEVAATSRSWRPLERPHSILGCGRRPR